MKLASVYLRSPVDSCQPQFKRAAPLLLPAIIGAGAALGSSALNFGLNRQMMNYKLDDAKDLMSYEWQNFQSPKAQVRALSAAGISPSVAYSSGGVGQFATPHPTMPTDSPFFVSGVDQFANAVSAIAQAKKAGVETVGQQLENKVIEGTVGERIREVALRNKWTEEQTSKVIQETSAIVGQCNVMQKHVEKLESDKKLTDKKVKWFDRHMRAEIEDLKQSAEYKKASAEMTTAQKELLDATFDDLVHITNLNAQQLEKFVGLLDKYGDAQAIVGMLSHIVASASDLLGVLSPKGFLIPWKSK